MYKSPIVCIFGINEFKFEKSDELICKFYENDNDLKTILVKERPNVLVSIGDSWKKFPHICKQPYQIKSKWIHYENKNEISFDEICYCYMGSLTKKDNNNPLVSIFTSTYNSEQKIYRPYNSLLDQKYQNWEWIIIDDSTDDGKTFKLLKKIKGEDYRIKIFKSDKNNGNIGELKYLAASMGKGDILVELDHDDELTNDCLSNIVNAYIANPDVGFFYTDFAELYEKDDKPFKYGDVWAMGYGGYYAQRYKDKILYVAASANLNPSTLKHIVGVPNHVRAWRASFYKEINGHISLPVADDYELLIRTFLGTKMMRIPYIGYLQYINKNGNTTVTRNLEIQKLTKIVSNFYDKKIKQKFNELNIEYNPQFLGKIWERPWNYHEQHTTIYMPHKQGAVSVVISTYNRPNKLKRAIDSVLKQTFNNYELIVIGDKCNFLDKVILDYNDERIRWWNLEKNSNDSGTTPKNYALRKIVRTEYVAYLDDDNTWEPNHLESLMEKINETKSSYAFSSFVMDNKYKILCTTPKLYRIDTSAILHKFNLIEKYGYWRPVNEYYAHDWELVSRWKNETYTYSGLFTVNYEVDPNKTNAKGIYEYYGDQPEFIDKVDE